MDLRSRLALTLLLVPALVVAPVAASAPGAGVAPATAGATAASTAPTVGPASTADRAADAGPPLPWRSQSDDDADEDPREDPREDVIGWEAGYWHNESIDVDQSDGLSDAELEAYVARAMARVEFIREREFQERVPVEVISRERYRERLNDSNASNASFEAWNDQVWEALFVVGEDRASSEALSSTRGASVAGFYTPERDEIRIITPRPDRPVIDNATLHHELVHALQDQYGGLEGLLANATTQDQQFAYQGVYEGEAMYVQRVYAQRCRSGEWDCVDTPSTGTGGGGDPNLGVLVNTLQPYSDGPVYVSDLVEEGGWDAYEARFERPPNTTEQVIHLTDERPDPLPFENRATGDWRTFDEWGDNGTDTAGEASIYTMFWYQTRTAGADAIDLGAFRETDSRFDLYNYVSEPSAGWGNDRIVPYRNGPVGDADTEYGYVWATTWDTRVDAREFTRAYLSILDAQGADVDPDAAGAARAGRVYVIPEGSFADAFVVVRDGTRVTVVNGPDPAAVEAIRPSAATTPTPTPTFSPTPTPTATATPAAADDGADTPTATATPAPTTADDPDAEATGAVETDGPGAVVALLAAVATVALLARRRGRGRGRGRGGE